MLDKLLTGGLVIIALVCAWLYLDKPTSVDTLTRKLSTVTTPRKVEAAPVPTAQISIRVPRNSVPAERVPAVNQLPDCNDVDTLTACELRTPYRGPLPTPSIIEATPATYPAECWPGSFYSCQDLAEIEAEDGVEGPATIAVATTDAFLSQPPVVQPEFQEAWKQACVNTPVDQRSGLLKATCEGAGL